MDLRKKNCLNDDDKHEADTKSSTYKAMKLMAKRIKLLETKLRIISDAQVRMQSNMEALIKKVVRRVSRLVKRATDNFLEANTVLDNAASATENFERISNLEHA